MSDGGDPRQYPFRRDEMYRQGSFVRQDPAVNDIPVLQQEELILHGELVTVMPIARCPLTETRLKMTYNQGARKLGGRKKNPEAWWMTALAPFQRVYSVGKTPIAAIKALGKEVGWGECHGFQKQNVENPREWYYRFWSGAGTSMKASGRKIPGGYICDWWI